MSIGFLSKSNISIADLAHGIRMADIPGDRGAIQSFILIISVNGLAPGTPCSVSILSPTNTPLNNSGSADESGDLSISTTWIRDTDDTHWLQVSHGSGIFPDGFWNVTVVGNFTPADNPSGGIDIQFSSTPVNTFTTDLIDTTHDPTHGDPNWDGSKGNIDLHVDYDNTSMEDPDSIAVLRNGEVVGTIPFVNGITSYDYTDVVFEAGDATYEFFVYKYPDSRSISTAPFTVTFGGAPSITMIMSGGITFGGSAIISFLGNPTGTYTIVKNKTNDTLYNTDENVAIPNPFVVTGFMPS